jgi:hypothetical protein
MNDIQPPKNPEEARALENAVLEEREEEEDQDAEQFQLRSRAVAISATTACFLCIVGSMAAYKVTPDPYFLVKVLFPMALGLYGIWNNPQNDDTPEIARPVLDYYTYTTRMVSLTPNIMRIAGYVLVILCVFATPTYLRSQALREKAERFNADSQACDTKVVSMDVSTISNIFLMDEAKASCMVEHGHPNYIYGDTSDR